METGCLYGRLLGKPAGLRMLSDRMRALARAGSGSWSSSGGGGPSSARADSVRCPVLSAPEYADRQRWLTESWGRCLGLPAPYATRIEALRETCLGLWWLLLRRSCPC